MTTTVQDRPTARVPMSRARKTAFVAGAFYLITFIASIPALFLIQPVLDNPDYIIGAGEDTRVILGCLLDMISAAACVGTAVALFPVVRRQNETLSLGFVTTRVLEAAIIMIGVVCLLAVVTLRQDLAGTANADTATLVTADRSLVAVRDWTFLLGPGIVPSLNALLLGSLLYQSRLVPRAIPTIGLIGAPLLLAAHLATLFGLTAVDSVWSGLATVPVAAWELAVGVWMIVRGFRPSPILSAAVPAVA
ncbi:MULTISPECIES: DUF4386 domain-containing protein [unclassified Pseudofrankia]|uniref:DUF4386 domain-containing protein n=1 Tax=unclassified Pseudofrankia TaxID=2994372 RepID=UPI0008DA1AD6|nr:MULTISPECIES: DUF4386 domain-containing protein [unclassified Pseudofrankia]MDT3438787.1 DUF4386 domain-containing protein [Pseudofrankia sp. BMG5.37]OHV75176.1 hypothetical protein BCD48_00025 [Pseudofrankia sp. BMG5.36]